MKIGTNYILQTYDEPHILTTRWHLKSKLYKNAIKEAKKMIENNEFKNPTLIALRNNIEIICDYKFTENS